MIVLKNKMDYFLQNDYFVYRYSGQDSKWITVVIQLLFI